MRVKCNTGIGLSQVFEQCDERLKDGSNDGGLANLNQRGSGRMQYVIERYSLASCGDARACAMWQLWLFPIVSF